MLWSKPSSWTEYLNNLLLTTWLPVCPPNRLTDWLTDWMNESQFIPNPLLRHDFFPFPFYFFGNTSRYPKCFSCKKQVLRSRIATKRHTRNQISLTLFTLTSAFIFSIRFSTYFLRRWWGNLFDNPAIFLVRDHFIYSCDPYVWLRDWFCKEKFHVDASHSWASNGQGRYHSYRLISSLTPNILKLTTAYRKVNQRSHTLCLSPDVCWEKTGHAVNLRKPQWKINLS